MAIEIVDLPMKHGDLYHVLYIVWKNFSLRTGKSPCVKSEINYFVAIFLVITRDYNFLEITTYNSYDCFKNRWRFRTVGLVMGKCSAIYISYICYNYTYSMDGDRKTDIPCLLVYNNVWFNNYNHTMVMMYVHHTSIGCQKGSSNNWSDGVIASRNGSFANRDWNLCMKKNLESDWPWYFEILRYQ